jgi:uncharacterized protein YjeT (DUF2065 family)
MKGRQLWVALVLLLIVAGMGYAGGAGYWRRYATAMLGGGVEASVRLVEPRVRVAGG